MILLILLMFQNADARAKARPRPEPTPTPTVAFKATEGKSLTLSKTMNVERSEMPFLDRSVQNADKTLWSDCFRKPPTWKLTSNKGKSWEQIVDDLRAKKWLINIDWFYGSFMQNRIWKTQGYDNGDGYVHANRFFIYEEAEMGSLILHETLHRAGYSHSSAGEYTSAPYTANARHRECQSR